MVVPPVPDHVMTVEPTAQSDPEKPVEATMVPLELPQRGEVLLVDDEDINTHPNQFATAYHPRVVRVVLSAALRAEEKDWMFGLDSREVPE